MYPFDLPGTVSGLLNAANSGEAKIQLVRVDPLANQTLTDNVLANGQFRFKGIGPGVYDVFIQGTPRNAYLLQAGFPYSDRRSLQIRIDSNLPPRSVHDENEFILISDVPLTASVNTGGLAVSGRVSDNKGGAVSGAEIILVPADASAKLRRDRYGITYSDGSGAFQLSGISPGSYTAYAFEKIEPDIYFDPEFNSQISSQGTLVNVGTGLSRPLDRALTVITKDDLMRLTR
jgi:hypothetical protein